jgi:hypothetical protein
VDGLATSQGKQNTHKQRCHNDLCFKNKFCLQGVKFGDGETVYPMGIRDIKK